MEKCLSDRGALCYTIYIPAGNETGSCAFAVIWYCRGRCYEPVARIAGTAYKKEEKDEV